MSAHAIEARPVWTPQTADPAQLALAGFQARYRVPHTAAAVRSDLKHFLGWLMSQPREVRLFEIQAPHLELYLTHLSTWVSPQTGRPLRPSSVARMFSTVKLFYGYAHDHDYIAKNPARLIKRPAVPEDDQGRHYLTPLEFSAILKEAKNRPMDRALVGLLGCMGLRISEATQLDIERNFGVEGGYETIHFIGKGHKPATMPLPVQVLHAVHAAIGDRTEGPLLLSTAGHRMDRTCAARILDRLAREVGITKRVTPHALRRTFCTAGLLSGVPLRDMQVAMRHADPSMTVRYDRMANGHDRNAVHKVAGYFASMAQ